MHSILYRNQSVRGWLLAKTGSNIIDAILRDSVSFVAFRIVAVLLWFVILLIALARPIYAQTPYAPGGLFVHPTAIMPRAHQFSIYAAAFTQDAANGTNASYYPIALTYTPTDRLQVSALATYHQDRDEASHTHLGAFLRYQIAPDTSKSPAFAISGGYSGNDHLESTAAAIVSHGFTRGSRVLTTLHAGAKWGRTPEDEGGVSDVGLFVGAQVPLNREWDLVGETSTRFKFDQASASSIGFMYHNRAGTGVSIAFVNGGRSSRMKFFFGIGFPLGH